mgnify:CR=1 FL=1
MTDNTRPADHLANTQHVDIPDLLNLADQISPAATVDAMFDDRDHDLEVLHRVKPDSDVSLCGIADDWNRIGAQSGPGSTSEALCPLCETLRAMYKQLDMTGLEEMPPR